MILLQIPPAIQSLTEVNALRRTTVSAPVGLLFVSMLPLAFSQSLRAQRQPVRSPVAANQNYLLLVQVKSDRPNGDESPCDE
jgi:hypothetical protein